MNIIVDLGMGNIASVRNICKRVGHSVEVSCLKEDIKGAERLILPGVGSFDAAMEALHKRDLVQVLNEAVLEKKTPILGICLGMQIMTKQSQEGVLPGLGWIDATVIKFDTDSIGLKVPHMGWSFVEYRKHSSLSTEIDGSPRFYFVHSYYVSCNSSDDVLMSTVYGHRFTSAFQKENIFGVQFHPEKSHKYGMKLVSNFLSI